MVHSLLQLKWCQRFYIQTLLSVLMVVYSYAIQDLGRIFGLYKHLQLYVFYALYSPATDWIPEASFSYWWGCMFCWKISLDSSLSLWALLDYVWIQTLWYIYIYNVAHVPHGSEVRPMLSWTWWEPYIEI